MSEWLGQHQAIERCWVDVGEIIENEELDVRRVEVLSEVIALDPVKVVPVLAKAVQTEQGVMYEVFQEERDYLVQALFNNGENQVEVVVLEGFEEYDLEDFTVEQLLWISEEYGVRVDRYESRLEVDGLMLEGKITHKKHVQDLTESMAGVTGQRIPIWVRARWEDGEIVYDVVDGYHRSESFAQLGFEHCKAEISYGMSDEELYDERVKAAINVEAVRFSRQMMRMQMSFEESLWHERGFRLSQLLSLVAGDAQ